MQRHTMVCMEPTSRIIDGIETMWNVFLDELWDKGVTGQVEVDKLPRPGHFSMLQSFDAQQVKSANIDVFRDRFDLMPALVDSVGNGASMRPVCIAAGERCLPDCLRLA